ncbi:MAG TPA: hypothetical protein VGR71_03115 [Nitrospira sp.]|nr:hypothetical protein [Nitrospira sp.]
MALLNFTANFSVVVSVLERIAHALERLAGPEPIFSDGNKKKRGPEAIIQYGNEEREWAKQHFRSLIREQGHAPEREEKLLTVAMKRYDYEKRHQDPNESEEL